MGRNSGSVIFKIESRFIKFLNFIPIWIYSRENDDGFEECNVTNWVLFMHTNIQISPPNRP